MLLNFSQNGITLTIEIQSDGSTTLKQFFTEFDDDVEEKNSLWCPLAEIHLSGENMDDLHGAKHTASVGARTLRYHSHCSTETPWGQLVEIQLSNEQINVTVHYQFYTQISAIRAWTTVENISPKPIGLEYVSSFAYTGIDGGMDYTDRDLKIYIPHNAWSREVNWQGYTPIELGLERWEELPKKGLSTKRIAVSNTGTWSIKEHLPMAAIVNTKRNSAWMFQIENNGSWNWEISDADKRLYVKISGPDEQENGWYKQLMPGEQFESVKVGIAVGRDFNDVLKQITYYRRKIFQNNLPNSKLPVIFNDYMNCLWGDPTEEKELPVIDRAAETGAEYFCMDAGWYANGSWWETVGEWQPAQHRFPNGIKYIFDYIRKKGMIPGIWLEIEVMGIQCPLANEWEDECFFMRHGKRVVDHGRYQLDFRHEKVRNYATKVIDRLVNEYGVGYLKMDYNIDGGVGTEINADSFGDGLLKHNLAYLTWMHETMKRHPELIWECCSSGGLRMDYAMLSMGHLQSVSDQSYYLKNTPIAAAAPTAVLPEQGAIWSYPMPEADRYETELNMINAMLGRIHLSGAITAISNERFGLVKEAIECYKTYRNDLSHAAPFYPLGIPNYHDAFLCLGMRFQDCTRLSVWCMKTQERQIFIPLEASDQDARILYPSNSECTVKTLTDGLLVTFPNAYRAVLIERRS